MATIGHMTVEELTRLINESVDRRFKQLLGEFEISEERLWLESESEDRRSLQEVLESIDRNMWTPPPGAKSSLELLREDREG